MSIFTVARICKRQGTLFPRNSFRVTGPFRRVANAFTLIEMLVSMGGLSMLILLLFGTITPNPCVRTQGTGKRFDTR